MTNGGASGFLLTPVWNCHNPLPPQNTTYFWNCSIDIFYFFYLPQWTVTLGWFFSLFSLAYLVYGLHVVHLDIAGSALYASVGHSAWGAALAWIVIACCTGYGGCVNSALSCRLLQPLSRLTYCAYLVHPIIMAMTNFQMDGPLHLHNLITVSRRPSSGFYLSFFQLVRVHRLDHVATVPRHHHDNCDTAVNGVNNLRIWGFFFFFP